MSDLFPEVAAAPVPAGETDSWFTPIELFRAWHNQYDFTVDVAGHEEAPASKWIRQVGGGHVWTIKDDGLSKSWGSQRVWCNPPYSDIEPWVRKAHYDIACGTWRTRPELVVMLVPANRTEQPWWQNFVERSRDGRSQPGDGFTLDTNFLPRRFKFGFPGDPEGKTSGSPTFGCVLLVWRRSP